MKNSRQELMGLLVKEANGRRRVYSSISALYILQSRFCSDPMHSAHKKTFLDKTMKFIIVLVTFD